MSELLSILFAAIFASAVGLNHTAAGSAKPEQNGEKMEQLNARPGFKHAENKANSDYKASIVDCKKKPSSEKVLPGRGESGECNNDCCRKTNSGDSRNLLCRPMNTVTYKMPICALLNQPANPGLIGWDC